MPKANIFRHLMVKCGYSLFPASKYRIILEPRVVSSGLKPLFALLILSGSPGPKTNG